MVDGKWLSGRSFWEWAIPLLPVAFLPERIF